MKRREFLKLSGAAVAGLAIPEWVGAGAAEKPAGSAAPSGASPAAGSVPPHLVVAHGLAPAAITRASIDALGGMRRFVSRGDVVVVKPNIGWDRRPEQAATTNPHVVATIVAMCLDAGAKRVRVFDNAVNDPRRTYVQSGIEDAVRKVGGEVSFVNERKFKDVAIKGVALTEWPLYTEALEADKLINVPIAKHHGSSGCTLALKNLMGLMGGNRGRVHQKIHESLADLATVFRPCLTVLDAVRILTANGPQGGRLEDVRKLDTIVAGVDQVAVDAFGATLFGKSGADLGFVVAAARRGLGTMDLSRLQIRRLEV